MSDPDYQANITDKDLAAFFQALRPNRLRRFQLIGMNRIEKRSITALSVHATSLRSLRLGCLEPEAMTALGSLSGFAALETFILEDRTQGRTYLDKQELKDVSTWISNCKSLRDLSLHLRDALILAKEAFSGPDIRLTSFSIAYFFPETESEWWTTLGSQTSLRNLTIGDPCDELEYHISSGLEESLCQLKSLASLKIDRYSVVNPHLLRRVASELPNLVELSFTDYPAAGEGSAAAALTSFTQLRSLSIESDCGFTEKGIYDFITKLDPIKHKGLKIHFSRFGWSQMSGTSLRRIGRYVEETLGGKFYPLNNTYIGVEGDKLANDTSDQVYEML